MPPRSLIALATCVLATAALAAGCVSDAAARRALRTDYPREQTAMIARVARENKASMNGDLIRLLEAEDEGVRFMAAVALHKVTGIDRGIQFAEGEKRQAIVAEWHAWYKAETGESVPDFQLEAPPPGEDTDEDTDADESADDAGDESAGETEDDETDAASPESGAAPAKAKETAG